MTFWSKWSPLPQVLIALALVLIGLAWAYDPCAPYFHCEQWESWPMPIVNGDGLVVIINQETCKYGRTITPVCQGGKHE